jgi:hypothetical protein
MAMNLGELGTYICCVLVWLKYSIVHNVGSVRCTVKLHIHIVLVPIVGLSQVSSIIRPHRSCNKFLHTGLYLVIL